MEHPFLARLARGPLLADGAMGTELYRRGVAINRCFELACVEQPDLVQTVHAEYLQAGAELIETNSFGANRLRLQEHGCGAKVRDINQRAARLARYARDLAGSLAFLGGAIGPLGPMLRPVGDLAESDALELFREQAQGLLEGGIDLFVIETFADLNELCLAVRAVKDLCDLPVIASASFDDDGRTGRGQNAAKVAGALLDLGVDVVGVNCGVGPQSALDVACQLMASGAEHVSMMPNAGLPSRSEGRTIYLSTPEYFGEMVPTAVDRGVALLGGCCGTRPEHIAAMRAALDAVTETTRSTEPAVCAPIQVAHDTRKGEAPEPTGWASKLAAGEFVTSIELTPPRGFRTGALLRHAREAAESNCVDAVNITDSPMARVRMDAVAACYMVQSQTGIETILHLTTRDRNLMGLESVLIGAHAMGVRNILALTGDPPRLGSLTQATGVYDVDSIGLLRILGEMKQGRDLAGTEMGHPGGFCVGAAVDPTKPDLETEARRLKEKVAAGAEYIMTQPIFDLGVWERFMQVYDAEITVPVILGIMPLQSERHATFLHHEVPGITLNDDVLDRMRRAGSEGRAEGVRMAEELLMEGREAFQGVYMMPSYNRCEMALEVLSVLDQKG